MIITHHEGACIRASAGDTTLVFAPISKQSKNFKPTNFGADVAFIPMQHADMNGAEEASRGDKQAFSIFGPGEYEIKEVAVASFPTKSTYGSSSSKATTDKADKAVEGTEHINTVYSIIFDGLHVLYLGALGSMDLPAELLEMDAPDILIVPVGGNGTLNPAEAQKLAVQLEAKVVIPILYDDKTLKQFLKEAGADGAKAVDKLTVKPRDVVDKENEVVVLSF